MKTMAKKSEKLSEDYLEAEIQRLQKEIYANDKKLIDKLLKSPKDRAALYPVFNNEGNMSQKSKNTETSPEKEQLSQQENPDDNVQTFKENS